MKKVSYDYENRYPVVVDGEEKEIISLARIEHIVTDSEFESNRALYESEAVGEITVEDIPESSEEQIAALKAQLEATDYKIIKCSEAQLVGEELPYDIAALHSERQALRDRINELESGGEGA